MSVQTDTIDADSAGQCVLTVREGPSRFSGRDEEFHPWEVSALNIIEPVRCQLGWTAPQRSENEVRMRMAYQMLPAFKVF